MKKRLITLALAVLLVAASCVSAMAQPEAPAEAGSQLVQTDALGQARWEPHCGEGNDSGRLLTNEIRRTYAGVVDRICEHGGTGMKDRRSVTTVIYEQFCTRCTYTSTFDGTEYGPLICGR